MLEYKLALSALAILLGLVSYVPYFKGIFSGHTKPHPFSWFVWALLTGIAFLIQLAEGGGIGAWVTGVTSLACLVIAALGVVKGENKYTLFDWIAFAGALFSLVLWLTTKDAVLSIFLVTLTDALAFLPSFRKGYEKPFEEKAITYAISSVKWIPAILALETLSLATWFYPASLILMNGAFVLMLVVRRKLGGT